MRRRSSGSVTSVQSSVLDFLDDEECFLELDEWCFEDRVDIVEEFFLVCLDPELLPLTALMVSADDAGGDDEKAR